MNILEQADKYAEGKANEAITKAIAEAYIEGYKAGYKDREEEIPLELRDNKTEYVDLGLPSRTLWSTDYEKLDGNRLYLPYEKAEYMKIPTKEQWNELLQHCVLKYAFRGNDMIYRVDCIGPNGQTISFAATGRKITSSTENVHEVFFWLEDESDNDSKATVHLYNSTYSGTHHASKEISNYFSGYKLPVRSVR